MSGRRRSSPSAPLAWLLGLLLVPAVLPGCASAPGVGAGGGAARAELERQARRERSRRPAPVERPGPPPGIDAALLEPRVPPSAVAGLPLEKALDALAAGAAAAAPPEIAPPGDEQRLEALRRYVHGRQDALAGRVLTAATRFEEARQLDPGSLRILRALAHSYAALGNPGRAVAVFRQLRRLAPDDSEAVLTLALAAVTRRDFDEAARLLARRRMGGGSFAHDPAADLIARHALHVALAGLGYDRASIEAGLAAAQVPFRRYQPTFYRARVDALYRRRAETWQEIGDAHCRLGEYGPALEAYAEAAGLPLSDPWSLSRRVVYADLCLGRTATAQVELIAAFDALGPAGGDRAVRLTEYLAGHLPDRRLLTRALVAMHRLRPDQPALARAAALLSPAPAAREILHQFLAHRPRDVKVAGQLLVWVGGREPGAALELAASLMRDQPDLAEAYARRLLLAVPSAASILDTAAPSSAAVTEARCHVLLRLADPGRAWDECRRGQERWPGDEGLRLMRIEIAGRLDEALLVEEACAAAGDLDGAWSWVVRAEAYRRLERFDEALRAADSARRAAEVEPRHRFDALLVAARIQAERGLPMIIGPRRHEVFLQAVERAEEAHRLAPARPGPFELLLALYGRRGALEDQQKYQETVARLRRATGDGRRWGRIAARRDLEARRFEPALEEALALAEDDPSDAESLALAVRAWQMLGRYEDAERWLRGHLEPATGDPTVLDQLVRLLLARERGSDARALLEARLAGDGDDPAARRLLEMVFQVTGAREEAFALGQRRLRARPEGTRRALQLALLDVRGQHPRAAAAELEWIAGHAGGALPGHLTGAIGLAGRLDLPEARKDKLTISLVEQAVRRERRTPLPLYAAGLLALARSGQSPERFQALAEQAAGAGPRAEDGTLAAVLPWRDLAQRLVDAGRTGSAAAVLRTRLRIGLDHGVAFDEDALGLLASMIVLADAAVSPDGAETVELLVDLDRRGAVPLLRVQEGKPTLAAALSAASQGYALVGNDPGSQRLLREAIRLDAGDAMAMNNLAYMRIEAGRHDPQTLAWIAAALAAAPEDSSIVDTAAWLRYKQGRLADTDEGPGALSLLRRLVADAPDPGPEVLDHYGDVLWRTGHPQEARQAWRSVQEALGGPERRTRTVQNYRLLQSRVWGLLVSDPGEIYHRDFGRVLERATGKLQVVEDGGEPAVAPRFDELNEPE